MPWACDTGMDVLSARHTMFEFGLLLVTGHSVIAVVVASEMDSSLLSKINYYICVCVCDLQMKACLVLYGCGFLMTMCTQSSTNTCYS